MYKNILSYIGISIRAFQFNKQTQQSEKCRLQQNGKYSESLSEEDLVHFIITQNNKHQIFNLQFTKKKTHNCQGYLNRDSISFQERYRTVQAKKQSSTLSMRKGSVGDDQRVSFSHIVKMTNENVRGSRREIWSNSVRDSCNMKTLDNTKHRSTQRRSLSIFKQRQRKTLASSKGISILKQTQRLKQSQTLGLIKQKLQLKESRRRARIFTNKNQQSQQCQNKQNKKIENYDENSFLEQKYDESKYAKQSLVTKQQNKIPKRDISIDISAIQEIPGQNQFQVIRLSKQQMCNANKIQQIVLGQRKTLQSQIQLPSPQQLHRIIIHMNSRNRMKSLQQSLENKNSNRSSHRHYQHHQLYNQNYYPTIIPMLPVSHSSNSAPNYNYI